MLESKKAYKISDYQSKNMTMNMMDDEQGNQKYTLKNSF